jgi:hypothetical protein
LPFDEPRPAAAGQLQTFKNFSQMAAVIQKAVVHRRGSVNQRRSISSISIGIASLSLLGFFKHNKIGIYTGNPDAVFSKRTGKIWMLINMLKM